MIDEILVLGPVVVLLPPQPCHGCDTAHCFFRRTLDGWRCLACADRPRRTP